MRVFLIQQKQLEEVSSQGRIKRVSIQRMDHKKWLPLFEIIQGEQTITASLRVQSREEARTWADLRLLADWLREGFGITRCELLLGEFKTSHEGKNENET